MHLPMLGSGCCCRFCAELVVLLAQYAYKVMRCQSPAYKQDQVDTASGSGCCCRCCCCAVLCGELAVLLSLVAVLGLGCRGQDCIHIRVLFNVGNAQLSAGTQVVSQI
jgi:hypothetical protein